MAEWSIARACKALKPSVQIRLVSPNNTKNPPTRESEGILLYDYSYEKSGFPSYFELESSIFDSIEALLIIYS